MICIKAVKKMPEQIIGTGEIINNACVKHVTVDSKTDYIITSDSENIFDLTVSFDNRATYQTIDFSQYSVLGKYADEGCKVVFDRNVTKNVIQQKYIYKITVINCGTCKELATSMNWVLIPKIEDDFSVEFVVEHKHWNNGR